MTIPQIASYPLPNEDALPTSRVDWQLDPSRAVLLIHDLQEYFLDFYNRDQMPVSYMLDSVARLKTTCNEAGVPVVYSAQPPVQTPEERALLEDMWGPGLTQSPKRCNIESTIAPHPSDTIITKWRYSAFARTGLEKWLCKRGKDQLIICGVYAHIGCQATAIDAFMLDIQPFIVADAVADFSLSKHESALQHVADCCGVVSTTGRVEAALLRTLESTNPDKRLTSPLAIYLRNELAELLQVPATTIDDTDDLIDQGLDSMRLMTLVESLNRTGAVVDFLQLAETPTIEAWCDKIDPLKARSA